MIIKTYLQILIYSYYDYYKKFKTDIDLKVIGGGQKIFSTMKDTFNFAIKNSYKVICHPNGGQYYVKGPSHSKLSIDQTINRLENNSKVDFKDKTTTYLL